jgi:hypothetical protein
VLSDVTGQNFEHVNISETEFVEKLSSAGVPKDLAAVLGMLDTVVANGGEARLGGDVEKVTGKAPKTFKKFVEENFAYFSGKD